MKRDSEIPNKILGPSTTATKEFTAKENRQHYDDIYGLIHIDCADIVYAKRYGSAQSGTF